MPVEMALTPDSRWEVGLRPLVDAASAAGFSALGLPADRVDEATAGLLRASGLRCHELLALVVGQDEHGALAAGERLAEAAGAAGAEWVLTTVPVEPVGPVATALRRCAALFDEVGAGTAVEFGPVGPVSSIAAAREVVAAVDGRGRAGVVVDSWHFSFGTSTWDDLASVPLDEIAYVQFADARAPESDRLLRETTNRRVVPGEGILELERFARVLRDRGWEGTVSVEVLSSELRALPVPDVVRRLHDAAARFWE